MNSEKELEKLCKVFDKWFWSLNVSPSDMDDRWMARKLSWEAFKAGVTYGRKKLTNEKKAFEKEMYNFLEDGCYIKWLGEHKTIPIILNKDGKTHENINRDWILWQASRKATAEEIFKEIGNTFVSEFGSDNEKYNRYNFEKLKKKYLGCE